MRATGAAPWAAHDWAMMLRSAARYAAALLCAAMLAVAAALPEAVALHLDDFVEGRMRAWDTPGLSLTVVYADGASISRGYGFADREAGIAMTDETLVVLGSTTKALTALAVMQLVEHGLVELDASLTRYLRWYTTPEGSEDRITIRQLMSHSSGYPWGVLFTGRRYPAELEDYVRWLRRVRLEAAPGARFGYSNDTFVILGLIIERVSGMPYEDYMRAHVLDPLGMTSTTFDIDTARERGLARGYQYQRGRAEPLEVRFFPSERPAGKLMASAAELVPYFRMLLGGGRVEGRQLISEASLRQMWTPVVVVDIAGLRYGLAWYLDTVAGLQLVSHPGSVRNSGSRFLLVPEAGLAVGVLSNVSRPLDPRSEVSEGIAAAALLFGEAPLEPPRSVILAPTRPSDELLRAVPGVYASAAGPVVVGARDGALVGSVYGHTFELEPAGGTTFLVRADFARLDGLELEFQAAEPGGDSPSAPGDRLALMGLWFAFRVE
jgi:CubicO group peptidase (beta-lactamase class C family)